MKTVKIEILSREAFAPFGRVLSTNDCTPERTPGVYDWFPNLGDVSGADKVSINMLTVKMREFFCKKFERHEHTTESLIPLTAGVIVSCIAPGAVSADRVHAFYVPVGTGICFNANVWHFAPHSIGSDSTCLVVFKDGTGNTDMIFDELSEPVGFHL